MHLCDQVFDIELNRCSHIILWKVSPWYTAPYPLLPCVKAHSTRGMATSLALFIMAHFCSVLLFGCDSPFSSWFSPFCWVYHALICCRSESGLVAVLQGVHLCPTLYVFDQVDWLKGKCCVYNFCSLKERNEVWQQVALSCSWTWWTEGYRTKEWLWGVYMIRWGCAYAIVGLLTWSGVVWIEFTVSTTLCPMMTGISVCRRLNSAIETVTETWNRVRQVSRVGMNSSKCEISSGVAGPLFSSVISGEIMPQ